MLETFFGGSPTRAVAALLDLPEDDSEALTMKELRKAVIAARNHGR
jgi:hypothetical protein